MVRSNRSSEDRWRIALFILCSSLAGVAEPAFAEVPLGQVRSTALPTGAVQDTLLADLDRDDDPELVVATGDEVDVNVRSQDGSFRRLRPGIADALLPSDPARLAAGDFDLDGDSDLVVCGEARRSSPSCRVIWNCFAESGRLGFACNRRSRAIDTDGDAFDPLVADIDGDLDADILLLPLEPHDAARVVRNDSHEERGRLTLARRALPIRGPISDAALVQTPGEPLALVVAARRQPARLFVYDDTVDAFVDRSSERGFSRACARARVDEARSVAAGDLNGDGLADVVLQDRSGAAVLLQDEAGLFRETTARGLAEFHLDAEGMIVEDFNRDGQADLFVAAEKSVRSRLFLNRTRRGELTALVFSEEGAAIGLRGRDRLASPSAFREPRDCDDAILLAVADGSSRGGGTTLFTFPDDSRGKTILANPAQAQTTATMNGACVQGTNAPDTLVGHRVSSILRGGGGNDRLVARAGLTVMRGGAGIDRFEAAGFTVIQLPREEVERGEVVDCSHADRVLIDSPFDIPALQAAGVQFVNCGGDGVECHDDAEHTRAGHAEEAEHDDDELDCHHIPLVVSSVSLGLAPTARALKHGLKLGFVGRDGFGFGSCTQGFECNAIGLDVCRNGNGAVPANSGAGRCYPSDFDGGEGPIATWCHDPYWARYRFDQLRDVMAFDGRRFVIPVTFWLPRSDATLFGGICTFSGDEDVMSIIEWHDSIANVMSGAMSFYGRWGIAFDYRFRTFEVPSDSAFVANPANDRCRIQLDPGNTSARSVGKLLEQFPDKFTPGEINIYLADVGGVSYSSKGIEIADDVVDFILLRGSAGAFGHEMGHGLGLAHPYDNNRAASGEDPDNAEARLNWFHRPFPDAGLDRLHTCSVDADCDDDDATPGNCNKAPGQAKGICTNLKKDCAEDGDHLCDTPWDTAPCFTGVGNNLGSPCEQDADCQVVSGNADRGTAFLTRCGSGGLCTKVECADSDDCAGGSFCANGTCTIWRTGIDSCCEIYTDTPPYEHNACYERRPNGSVVPVPGVGPVSYWPIAENIMSYYEAVGVPRTITDGQRDQIVCNLGYRQDLGIIFRHPHANGEPCSLRPGDDGTNYGDPGTTRLIPHGACASGVCQLTNTAEGSTTECVTGTCNDGVKGEGEISLDCGGVCPNPCPTTRDVSPKTSQCVEDGDCISGYCKGGTCAPTCEDGEIGGEELATDAGGIGFDHSCSTQGANGLCRWEDDCAGALSCEGDGYCVLSTDCPVNANAVNCDSSGDCVGGGECVKSGSCAIATCANDAMCPSGVCQLPEGRCRCAEDADCPVNGNTCALNEAFCLDQCVDGRCLGTCELGIGG